MQDSAFLTGATGFVGTYIVLELLESTDLNVFVLVRAKNIMEAERKLSRLWWEIPMLKVNIGERIIPVPGDITSEGLGIEKELYKRITRSVKYVIHAAADVDLKKSREELWRINVHGTKNLLGLAKDINDICGLKRFSHISTAYVAGLLRGSVAEELLAPKGFASLYEESKHEAELLVKNQEHIFPISIFRPGQIVGNSKTGVVNSFNTVYYPLKLFLNDKLRVVPARKNMKINLVPIDYVADAIVRLTIDDKAKGLIFHLTAPSELQPTAKELLDFTMVWAGKRLQAKPKKPVFMNIPFFTLLGTIYNLAGTKGSKKKSLLSNLVALAPYFNENRKFSNENSVRLLGMYKYDWREYLPNLLEYAVYKGFLNHSGRTVFEQLMFRVRSKRKPINYYNITEEGIKKITGPCLYDEVNKAVSALAALGARKGSKIAVIGYGGTRYLTLDVAIGLLGAVSVPLYITTPLEEIDMLLKRSDSDFLFIGSQKILEQLDQLKHEIKTVSFCNTEANVILKRQVLKWEEFLAFSTGNESSEGVDFNDVATIRYTSGTTGLPKGVVFNHYNLKWMAESLASMLSWKMRNSRARYLSFLPMSHAAEGILACYASYYNLFSLDIYYLDNFNLLLKTLPKVKPSFFFSVPRFYEKLWNGFCSSSVGSFYLGLRSDGLKQMLKPAIRMAMLRKSGLDKCLQLVSGSAPISTELLKSFGDLGIEVFNAYGLTEAPLVTFNRLGNNELGTVGEPLPRTDIKIADDGEILVKGPQVTCGYYGDDSKVVSSDGYFNTGDLGEITESGKLIVSGRKKELIITSYANNIQPLKIEGRLKTLKYITEAMMIGDNLPYCIALLWIDKNFEQQLDNNELSKQIDDLNTGLSNPERIKRWAVVKRQLSINGGELTPNLKLRREVIVKNYSSLIDALYNDKPLPDYVYFTDKQVKN